MVSMKILSVAALVLFAGINVGATNYDVSVIRTCSEQYYDYFDLDYQTEWRQSEGLLGGIVKAVGGLLQTVGGLVSGILGLLGQRAQPKSLGDLFYQPRTNGDVINLLIKGTRIAGLEIIILNKPIYDRINPGLGSLYLRIVLGNLVIGLSARGQTYSGLKLQLLNRVNKSQWLSILGLVNIGTEWRNHCRRFGGIGSLPEVKQAHYLFIDELVSNLLRGEKGFVPSLLNDVLYLVNGLVGLVGNLVNGAVDTVLDVLFSLTRNLFVNVNVNLLQTYTTSRIEKYDTQYFSECYSYSY